MTAKDTRTRGPGTTDVRRREPAVIDAPRPSPASPSLPTSDARATWVRLAVAAVLLGLAYVALAVVVGRQVPSQASVEGIDVGGMTPAVASATLKRELAATAAAPVTVAIGQTGRTITIDPSSSGLGLDIDGTLQDMSGFTLDPRLIWQHLTGDLHRPVLTTVDLPTLTEAVTTQVKTVETPARDGVVSFTGGRVSVIPAQIGMQVDAAALISQVRHGYPRTPSLVAAVSQSTPKVSQAKVEQAVSSFAAPAMSAPISLVVGGRTAPLLPSQVAPYLAMKPDATGTLHPTLDATKVTALVQSLAMNFLQQPVDATITLRSGKPVVTPSIDGTTFDAATVPAAVLAALTDPARTASLKPVTAKPSFTTDQATALGVGQVIASFDSPIPANASRTATLVSAAATLNGTLVKPGATFSLTTILGQRTADAGYQEGYVKQGSRLVRSTTGAMSQISTVTWNLAWFAGAQLGYHAPHATYLSRYPEGRDTVVSWPGTDTTWKNNSPYGMLVQMTVSDNQVHGRIWGTKVYDVEAQQGARTDIVAPQAVTDTSSACVPDPGGPGFAVTVTRVLSKDGVVVKSEPYSTTYAPVSTITCTAPKPSR